MREPRSAADALGLQADLTTASGTGIGHAVEWDPAGFGVGRPVVGESLLVVLDHVIRTGEPLASDLAIHVIAEAALRLGLGAPHRVHGDLHPGHVIVGYDGSVSVVDPAGPILGLRRANEPGRLGYRSPEHAAGGPLTPASDVFSLGTLLFELSAAQRLGATSAAEQQVLGGAFPRPRLAHGGQMPIEVTVLLRKLLRARPSERFADGASCADGLRLARTALKGMHQEALGAWMRRTFAERYRAWARVLAPLGIELDLEDGVDADDDPTEGLVDDPLLGGAWAALGTQAAPRLDEDPDESTRPTHDGDAPSALDASEAARSLPRLATRLDAFAESRSAEDLNESTWSEGSVDDGVIPWADLEPLPEPRRSTDLIPELRRQTEPLRADGAAAFRGDAAAADRAPTTAAAQTAVTGPDDLVRSEPAQPETPPSDPPEMRLGGPASMAPTRDDTPATTDARPDLRASTDPWTRAADVAPTAPRAATWRMHDDPPTIDERADRARLATAIDPPLDDDEPREPTVRLATESASLASDLLGEDFRDVPPSTELDALPAAPARETSLPPAPRRVRREDSQEERRGGRVELARPAPEPARASAGPAPPPPEAQTARLPARAVLTRADAPTEVAPAVPGPTEPEATTAPRPRRGAARDVTMVIRQRARGTEAQIATLVAPTGRTPESTPPEPEVEVEPLVIPVSEPSHTDVTVEPAPTVPLHVLGVGLVGLAVAVGGALFWFAQADAPVPPPTASPNVAAIASPPTTAAVPPTAAPTRAATEATTSTTHARFRALASELDLPPPEALEPDPAAESEADPATDPALDPAADDTTDPGPIEPDAPPPARDAAVGAVEPPSSGAEPPPRTERRAERPARAESAPVPAPDRRALRRPSPSTSATDVRVTAFPMTARIVVDGTEVPNGARVPVGATPVNVRIVAEGYESQSFQLTRTSKRERAVVLRRKN